MSVLTQLATVSVNCADPVALAAFYQKATGWQLADSGEDFAALSAGPAGPGLAFVRVPADRTPNWPEDAPSLHLDFTVADLPQAVAALLALGAGRPDFQPGGDGWTVLTDPEGHPFCLVPASV
ncbi:VOC family protein [Kitasatospora sp. NPDC059795]|uniref:VOC family protein n=1 Tax=Kitasatospora sp. NPDC059795 TaxID=3346949 RepID=UPI0036550873